MKLGLIEAVCDALDVAGSVSIETNVSPADALVVRAGNAAPLLALGLVLITQCRITDVPGVVTALCLLRGVDDGDIVLI